MNYITKSRQWSISGSDVTINSYPAGEIFITKNTHITGSLNVTGSVSLQGGFQGSVTKVSANYQILSTDHYLGCTTGSITVTLPTYASLATGSEFIVKDETGVAATSNIILSASSGETIDGVFAQTISGNYNSITTRFHGLQYGII